jgi:predicted DNA-binding protein (MmcQ/YjbR family)
VSTFDDVRAIALALPEAEEKLTWDTDVTFRVRDKIFVIGADGSDGISLKASLDVQADLLALDAETFKPAPYVGRYGWVSVDLPRIDTALLAKLVRDAWRATAPKNLRGLVPE